MLYVQLSKALYGMLRAALLFYKKLRGDLEDLGFEINPYDPCVANKMINGKQITVCWHVDDLKVSHEDETVLDWFEEKLVELYGKKTTVHRGDGPDGQVFDYLGQHLDFESKPGSLIVGMVPYLDTIIKEWPEQLKNTKVCPANDNLFVIRDEENRELLNEELAMQFHRTTAQLLFLTMRARPDVQTAVSFFTTRVKSPDKDDWGKLRHTLMYLKGTLHMKRIMRADDLTSIHWWVDGSFGVHWDSKGHTGAMMSMGRGSIVNVLRKYKLNVGSSTESELVSIADVLGMMMWCKYFMEAQGYTIENNLLYQDNKSTILLAKNGRLSAGKNSKHIKNRFFLVCDKIAQGDLQIMHRGAPVMWADINTKPLQGQMFRLFRSKVMGICVDYDDNIEQKRTHHLLLPKKSPEGLVDDKDIEILKQAIGLKVDTKKRKVSKKPVKVPKKPTKRLNKGSIPQQPVHRKVLVKRRSVLSEAKFGPGDGPNWAVGRARYPNFARVLAQESDPNTRSQMIKSRYGTSSLPRPKRAVGHTNKVLRQ